jgi:DnaJ family protein C protein 2
MNNIRYLCDSVDGFKGAEAFHTLAELTKKAPEPAGLAYHRRQLSKINLPTRTRGRHAHAAAAAPEEEDDVAADSLVATPEETRRLEKAAAEGNHYGVLGLQKLNVNASDEQIKKAYRRLALLYHPDKKKQAPSAKASSAAKAAGVSDDPLFLAIQKANDVLSNDKSRRLYDSQFDFDESIPSGTEAMSNPEVDFFRIYGPVFERNSRWSVQKPVPRLGTMKDDDETVNRFYSFWHKFESWRDFSGEGEHKPEDASDRYEKRWMERENEKVAAKKTKKEIQRLADLVVRAQAKDPRVVAMRKREEEEKKAAQQQREQEKRAKEEADKKRAEDEAAAAKLAEETRKAGAASRKTAKEAEKKAIRLCKVELKKLCLASDAAIIPMPVDEDMDLLVANATGLSLLHAHQAAAHEAAATVSTAGSEWFLGIVAQVRAAAAAAGPQREESALAAMRFIDEAACAFRAKRDKTPDDRAREEREAAERLRVERERLEKEKAEREKEREWSVQEMSMLAKGVSKFPAGTRNRWVCIAEYVNGLGMKIQRNADECVAKARAVAASEDAKRMANDQAYKSFLQARKGGEEGVEIKDRDAPQAQAQATIVGPAAPAAPAAPVVAVAPPAPAAAADAGAAATGESGVWTADQQAAFEKALRTYPASLDKNERWKLIAEAVPGKSKKDCVARFKEIREKVLAQSGAKPASS